MKFTTYCIIISICLFTAACTDKETPGGIKYKVIKKGDGKEPPFGQFLVMNMELKDSKDSIWFSSKETGNPVVIPVQDASMEKDEGEYGVFKQLTVGDSVTFQVEAQTVFMKTRRRAVPQNIDPKSLFKFNVGVKGVWTEAEVQAFQQKVMIESQQEQVKADSITISNYLAEKGIEAIGTPSGLRYVVKKEGSGPLITSGQTASVHYAGYLLDGSIFDTSLASVAKENNFNNGGRNEPYEVVVDTRSVIVGWDEILLLMKKGMQVTVYVPSTLAYGSRSNGSIPANAILVFDMEVTNVK